MASNVAEALAGLGDLERGITRSLHGTAAPAEFYNVMRRMASIAPKLGVPVSHTQHLTIHSPRWHCQGRGTFILCLHGRAHLAEYYNAVPAKHPLLPSLSAGEPCP